MAVSWSLAPLLNAVRKSAPIICCAIPETSRLPWLKPKQHKSPGDGLQQAKDYADILGLKFAYATNGHGIIEFDYLTGLRVSSTGFLHRRNFGRGCAQAEGLTDETAAQRLLTPFSQLSAEGPRYYQEIAINRAVQAILQGKRRILLTMATGTGKTMVAFQICWKLWNARWNRTGDVSPPQNPLSGRPQHPD